MKFLSIEPLLEDLGDLDLTGINWVIVGGESGPGARRMEPEWVQSIFFQCRAENVPFFFKQWGGVQKSHTGRLLNGRTYDEMPAIRFRHVLLPAHRRALLKKLALSHRHELQGCPGSSYQ
jgi:protein gp37